MVTFEVGANVEFRCGCPCCDAAPEKCVWFQATVVRLSGHELYELVRRRESFVRRRRSSRDLVYVPYRLIRPYL